jgi:trigger factor
MKTTVTELPESRVRVEAEVPAEEVQKRVDQAARAIGRDLRVPGFRKGKVPPPVVIRRIGREAVLDDAVRNAMGRWYAEAVDAAGVTPIGDPDLDLGDLPAEGEPLTFTIEVGVRPAATLGTYKGLEVPRREPDVEDAAVDEEIEQLRERQSRLDTKEGAAEKGDFLVLDYLGRVGGEPFQGGEGRDQLIELGAEQLIPGFEDQLLGAGAGDEREVRVTFPDDYPATHVAGQEAVFEVTVKEVKVRDLPELDDEFALEAGGFDTLDELRADVRTRLEEQQREGADREFREAALDAAVAEATIEVPEALVDARARELWDNMLHSLSHQGISKDAYLRISGRTEEDLLAEARPDAEQALKRGAVLAAVVQAEGIEVSEDELREAAGDQFERLRSAGRLDDLREQLAERKALDAIVDSAKPVSPGQAAAREKLWTPSSAS